LAWHLLVAVHLPLLGTLLGKGSMLTICWLLLVLLLLLPRCARLLGLMVAVGRLVLVAIGLLGSIGLQLVTIVMLLQALLLQPLLLLMLPGALG
jgi:hypothetical protein